MLGWILGGAAALGLGWYGYKHWKGTDTVVSLLDFKPFAVKQGQSYVFKVLAPPGLEAFVMKMFKDDVATPQISPVRVETLTLQGPQGGRNVDLYEHRVIWKAPDATFTPESGMQRLGISKQSGISPARALAAALYQAAGAEAGTEPRLRFFPVAAELNAATSAGASVYNRRSMSSARGVG